PSQHRVPLRPIHPARHGSPRTRLNAQTHAWAIAFASRILRRPSGAQMAGKQRPSSKTPARATAKTSETAAAEKASTTAKRKSANDATASGPLGDINGERSIAELGDDLVSGKKTAATQAAKVIETLLEQEPEAVVPIIDRFVKAIAGEDKRAAQT